MIEKFEGNYQLTIIRGATTAKDNSVKEIESAVVELIEELITRNNIVVNNLLSVIFTVTNDLDACFPASIARKSKSLDSVAFLDCQQMYVPNDVDFCIRLMALVISPSLPTINHPYLRGASNLRSDRC